MYQALQKSALIRAVAGIGALAMLMAWLLMKPESPADYIRMVAFAATGSMLLITLLGTSPIWKLFWWICPPLNRWVFPNISGSWEFTIESNIAEIAKYNPHLNRGEISSRVTGTLEIRQNLFSIGIALNSGTDYSISDTIFVKPTREEETGRFYITTVFQNRTPRPLPTDEQMHLGAARIEIIGHGKSGRMSGVYWTNRNWQKAMNTAGTIRIVRGTK